MKTIHSDMRPGDRYEIIVYDGDATSFNWYTDDKATADRYAALNGGCAVIDMNTGDTRMWL